MRVLISALGSYGDVHPMVGLGAAMLARGHEVAIISNPYFRSVIEAAGVDFLPIGTPQDYEDLTHNEDLWDPFRGPQMILRTTLKETLRPIYEHLEAEYRPGETVLASHCLDMASRVFQEKHDAPLASVHVAPVTLRSFHQSPKMFGMWMADWTPRWLRRLQYWLADRFFVDRIVGLELNAFRHELGLPPVSGILSQWYFSPQLVLGIFPDWFAPPQPDWPVNTYVTGFPLWDQSATMRMPEDVSQFLSAGEPPIVFAPGSAMTCGEQFFEAAVDACGRLGRRGILLTKYTEQLPKNLPESIGQFPFVPFSLLLPRAAALVHHGGIGTSAEGLAAGLPHLVMPMAYDQLDNATRLKRLGVAEYVRRKRFRGPAVARLLHKLLASESMHENCRRWSEAFDTDAALQRSCELMEGLCDRKHSERV